MYSFERVGHRIAVVIVTAVFGVSCASRSAAPGPRVVQPGAPGEPSRVGGADRPATIKYTTADVKFMQGMIGHHAQALEMTALLPSRTAQEPMKLLARRIDVSQTDEIRMMQRWLEARGLEAPGVHAHHAAGATLMPGMLTPEEMTRLAEAKGAAFDRLFLELMIKHHEGALVMVRTLLSESGAAQDSDIFAFVSDVEADQSMEIERMRAMLAAWR
ncbi:MAG TPA: DUF305 domain-containing protein [Vicinamibacterales bacterium]|nr:DUF305 domain-containing protein [Vicinamibacterales bacterium]